MKVTGLSEIVRQQRKINDLTLIEMMAFIVNRMQKRVINDDGEVQYCDKYLFIKLIACRTKQPPIVSFKHRFETDNDMRLIEDIGLAHPVSTSNDADLIRDRINQSTPKSIGKRKIIGN